jgi:ketosteroid isomerase-like protein
MDGRAEAAFAQWTEGDVEGLLSHFADDARFFIPGSTTISGEFDGPAFRTMLSGVMDMTASGRHRQELVCGYEGTSGVVWVLDNVVTVGDAELTYHSAHEWIRKGATFAAWMVYVHEYDVFERAWSSR